MMVRVWRAFALILVSWVLTVATHEVNVVELGEDTHTTTVELQAGAQQEDSLKPEDNAYTDAELKQAVREHEGSASTRSEMAHARKARDNWLQKLQFAQAAMATAKGLGPPGAPGGPGGFAALKRVRSTKGGVDPVLAARLATDNSAREVLRSEDAYDKASKKLVQLVANARGLQREAIAAKREMDSKDVKMEQLKEQIALEKEMVNERAVNVAKVTTRGGIELQTEAAQLSALVQSTQEAAHRVVDDEANMQNIKALAMRRKHQARHALQQDEVAVQRWKLMAHSNQVRAEQVEAELKHTKVATATLEERADAETGSHRHEVMSTVEDAGRVFHRYKKRAQHDKQDAARLKDMLQHYTSRLAQQRTHANATVGRYRQKVTAANRTVSDAQREHNTAEEKVTELEAAISKDAIAKEGIDRSIEDDEVLAQAKHKEAASKHALATLKQEQDDSHASEMQIGVLKREKGLLAKNAQQAVKALNNSQQAVEGAKGSQASVKAALKVSETAVAAARESEIHAKKRAKMADITATALSEELTAYERESDNEVTLRSKDLITRAAIAKKAAQVHVAEEVKSMNHLQAEVALLRHKRDHADATSYEFNQTLIRAEHEKESKIAIKQAQIRRQVQHAATFAEAKKRQLASESQFEIRRIQKETSDVIAALEAAEESEHDVKVRVKKQVEAAKQSAEEEERVTIAHEAEEMAAAKENEKDVEAQAHSEAKFIVRKAKLERGDTPESAARQEVFATELQQVATSGESQIKQAEEDTEAVRRNIKQEREGLLRRLSANTDDIKATGSAEMQNAEHEVQLAVKVKERALAQEKSATLAVTRHLKASQAIIGMRTKEDRESAEEQNTVLAAKLNQQLSLKQLDVKQHSQDASRANHKYVLIKEELRQTEKLTENEEESLGSKIQQIDHDAALKLTKLKSLALSNSAHRNLNSRLVASKLEAKATAKELAPASAELRAAKSARTAAISELLDAEHTVAAAQESMEISRSMRRNSDSSLDSLTQELNSVLEKFDLRDTDTLGSRMKAGKQVALDDAVELNKAGKLTSELQAKSTALEMKIQALQQEETRWKAEEMKWSKMHNNRIKYMNGYKAADEVAEADLTVDVQQAEQDVHSSQIKYTKAKRTSNSSALLSQRAQQHFKLLESESDSLIANLSNTTERTFLMKLVRAQRKVKRLKKEAMLEQQKSVKMHQNVLFMMRNMTDERMEVREQRDEATLQWASAVKAHTTLVESLKLTKDNTKREEQEKIDMVAKLQGINETGQSELQSAVHQAKALAEALQNATQEAKAAHTRLFLANSKLRLSQSEVTEANEQFDILADKKNSARSSAGHAEDNLIQEEHAEEIAAAKKVEDDVEVARKVTSETEQAMADAQKAHIEAEEKAKEEIEEESQKTAIERSVLDEKLRHQTEVLDDRTEKQLAEYADEVSKHKQRMSRIEDEAEQQDDSSTQLVDKVNKYVEASEDEAKLRIAKAVQETQDAERKTHMEEEKADHEHKLATKIEADAVAAQKKQEEAEVAKATAEQELAEAQKKLASKRDGMKLELEEIQGKLKLESNKAEEARLEVKLAEAAKTHAETAAYLHQQNQTQAEANLAIAKVNEQTKIQMAQAKVEATKTQADIKVQSKRDSAKREADAASEQAAVELQLLKLRDNAKIDASQHRADMNISHADFESSKTVTGSKAEEKLQQDRRVAAEQALAIAKQEQSDSHERMEEYETKISEITAQPLPTIDDLDPKGKDWSPPSVATLMKP